MEARIKLNLLSFFIVLGIMITFQLCLDYSKNFSSNDKKVMPEKQCPFTEEAEGIKFVCNVVFTADGSKIFPALLENTMTRAVRVKEVVFTDDGVEVTKAIYRLEAKSTKKVSRDGRAYYLYTLDGVNFGFFK